MLDMFTPVAPEARRENLAAYRDFLTARDGDVDVERRTLTRREERMKHYDRPLAKVRPIDQALFDQQYADFDPRRETSQEMLLLLTLVKTNAAEAYGVERTFDKVYRRAMAAQDDIELVLLIEETYHTRILLSASQLYGMNVTAPYKPRAALMALIGGIATMPEFVSRPLTLAGEIVGVAAFLQMLEAAGRILKDDPELRDAIEERLIEVLVDEVGHMSFNRMCMGRAGMAQARAFMPVVGATLSRTIGELHALGVRGEPSSAMLARSPGAFPEAVRRSAFLA